MTNLPSLSERIDTTFQALCEGVEVDSSLMIDTTLEALSELMVESIQTNRFDLLSAIQSEFESLYEAQQILEKATNGELSPSNLERLTNRAKIPDGVYFNHRGEHNIHLIAELIAVNHVRFKAYENKKANDIFGKFLLSRSSEALSIIFGYILSNILKMDDGYFNSVAQSSLYSVDFRSYSRAQADELKLICGAIINNQELFIDYLRRYRKLYSKSTSPISFDLVKELHSQGLAGIAEECLPGLMKENVSGSQYLEAEEMGFITSKDEILPIYLGSDYQGSEPELAYVIGSDTFTAAELEEILKNLQDEAEDCIVAQILPRLAKNSLELAFKGKKPSENSPQVEKATLLIDYVLNMPGDPNLSTLKNVVVGLPGIPKSFLYSHPALRDHRFGQDLGL